MDYKLELMYSGGNLEGYHVTCYHCLCKKGEIIEERNLTTGGLHVTIDCLECNQKYKVVYRYKNGFKTFELRRRTKHELFKS